MFYRSHRLIVALAIIAGWVPSMAAQQELLLVNANIVDPATQTIETGNLLLRDGVIVGRPDRVPTDFSGTTLDLTGGWVIPGLSDLHVHSFGNANPEEGVEFLGAVTVAQRILRAGVVRFLDLFNVESAIFGQREQQRRGEFAGADLFAAGPCLTATNGHCSEYGVPTRIIDTPEDARREVSDLATAAPDVVKIVYDHQVLSGGFRRPTIDQPTLAAAIAEARRHDLATIIHVGTWDDVRDAVEAGATAVTHTPIPEPVPDDVVALMASAGTVHIPTLVVQTALTRIAADLTQLDDPLLVAVTSQTLRDSYRQMSTEPGSPIGRFLEWQRSGLATSFQSVRRLARAGVPMLTGTDAGNLGTFHGYSVHQEMALLVEAGLSPWEALAASTTNVGTFLHRRVGVRTGDEASLVVLDASPIDDIAHTTRIQMVIHRGAVVYSAGRE